MFEIDSDLAVRFSSGVEAYIDCALRSCHDKNFRRHLKPQNVVRKVCVSSPFGPAFSDGLCRFRESDAARQPDCKSHLGIFSPKPPHYRRPSAFSNHSMRS